MDLKALQFKTSPFCDGGGCVAVALSPGRTRVVMRDDKLANSPVLLFPVQDWSELLVAIKAGRFDLSTLGFEPMHPGHANCISVALGMGGMVEVWDVHYPAGTRLHFTPTEWAAFLAGVRANKFDRAVLAQAA